MSRRRRKTLRSPRRAHRERQRRITRIVLVLLLCAGAGGGLLYLLSLPVFTIEQVEVRGTEALSPEEIREFTEEKLLGRYFGLVPRHSVFFYPRNELMRALSAEFERVEKTEFRLQSVSVLTLFITERAAAAMLCNALCYLVDESGFVFAPAKGEEELLRFTTASADVSVGSRFLDGEHLVPLLLFIRELRGLGLVVNEVRVDETEFAVLVRGGARLLFLVEPEYGHVLKRLQLLLAEKELFPKDARSIENLEYLDLRYGNKIYFKPR